MVIFSAGELVAVADISGDDVDFAIGDGDGARIAAAGRGVNGLSGVTLGGIGADSLGALNPLPFQPPFGGALMVALGAAEGTAIEPVVAGDRVVVGFDCGIRVGDTFGTSKRPRRCDGVGEIGGE